MEEKIKRDYKFRAFIRKNTPELREKLKQRGVSLCSCCKFPDAVWLSNCIENIWYTIHGVGYTDETMGIETTEEVLSLYLAENQGPNKHYDCKENEELFLALVAYNTTDDLGQLFHLPETQQYFVCNEVENKNKNFVKCTPQEIIEFYEGSKNCNLG